MFQVYSEVIQLYIHIYILFFRFFSFIGYCKILNIVPGDFLFFIFWGDVLDVDWMQGTGFYIEC